MNLVEPQAISRCERLQSRLLFPPRRVSLAALPRSTISLRRTPYFQHLTSVPALGSVLTTGAVICRPPRHRIRDAARARIIFLCLPGVTARCAFTTGLLSGVPPGLSNSAGVCPPNFEPALVRVAYGSLGR